MTTDPSKPKRLVRYFFSYAHDDGKLPEKLLVASKLFRVVEVFIHVDHDYLEALRPSDTGRHG